MAAVSIVAATFMAGLAIGSYLLGKYADQESNLLRIYAFLEIGIALFALSFPPALKVVNHLHIYFERLFGHLPLLDHFLHL
jgi:spermidine synthase